MPLEDFTTYTEVDPNSKISATATQAFGDNLTRNETAFLYKDKGTNYFGGDFIHTVDVKWDCVGATKYGWTYGWGMSNAVDFLQSGLRLSLEATGDVGIIRIYNNAGAHDEVFWMPENTWYYLTITRVNVTVTVYIYSDSARTTLLDTLVVTESPVIKYRYIYALSSCNTGHADREQDCWTANLDLGIPWSPSSVIVEESFLAPSFNMLGKDEGTVQFLGSEPEKVILVYSVVGVEADNILEAWKEEGDASTETTWSYSEFGQIWLSGKWKVKSINENLRAGTQDVSGSQHLVFTVELLRCGS